MVRFMTKDEDDKEKDQEGDEEQDVDDGDDEEDSDDHDYHDDGDGDCEADYADVVTTIAEAALPSAIAVPAIPAACRAHVYQKLSCRCQIKLVVRRLAVGASPRKTTAETVTQLIRITTVGIFCEQVLAVVRAVYQWRYS